MKVLKPTRMHRTSATASDEIKLHNPNPHVKNYEKASEWRKLVLKSRVDINTITEIEEADQPIPLTNGDNKTNVRFSQMNEKALHGAIKAKKAANYVSTKENNLDLSESIDEATPKINDVFRFPSFNKAKIGHKRGAKFV